jgi:hypothetical protein
VRTKILAITGSAVLVAVFSTLALSNDSLAQVAGESRVLQAILGLTEVIKVQSEGLIETTQNIEDDLQFKKKFWEFRYEEGADSYIAIGVFVTKCPHDDLDACAFNVEGVQIIDTVNTFVPVDKIFVNGVPTDVLGEQIRLSANVLLGKGPIGAHEDFFVKLYQPITGSFHLVGEKPQGMELCLFTIDPSGNFEFESKGCPPEPGPD